MSILDFSKKINDPIVTAYNGDAGAVGSPASVSFGSTPTAFVTNVDILRRQYNNDQSGLETSLLSRQLGFNEDLSGEVTLVFKDDDGDIHEFSTSASDGKWEDGNAGFITPKDGKGLELSAEITSSADINTTATLNAGAANVTNNLGVGGVFDVGVLTLNKSFSEWEASDRWGVYYDGPQLDLRYLVSSDAIKHTFGHNTGTGYSEWFQIENDRVLAYGDFEVDGDLTVDGTFTATTLTDHNIGELQIRSTALQPSVDSGLNLGFSSRRFGDVYFDRMFCGNFQSRTRASNSSDAVFGNSALINSSDEPIISRDDGSLFLRATNSNLFQLLAYSGDTSTAKYTYTLDYNATYPHDWDGDARFQDDLTVDGEILGQGTDYTSGWTNGTGMATPTIFKFQEYPDSTIHIDMDFTVNSQRSGGDILYSRSGDVFGLGSKNKVIYLLNANSSTYETSRLILYYTSPTTRIACINTLNAGSSYRINTVITND